MNHASDGSSAYVILVNDDNTMIATQKRRIMQRSKLVDNMWFLANPVYNGVEMKDFTVIMEYILPVSRRYCSEVLVLSNETHNDYLKYVLPFDTEFTSEAGDIELQLTFTKVSLDESGKSIQLVRKISGTTVPIIPICAWSDIIPDSALTALDQRIIKTDAQIKALDEMGYTLQSTKADNIKYDRNSNTLQLLSGNKEIGDKVMIMSAEDINKDGIPVVDFSRVSSGTGDGNLVIEDNVVEF